MYANKYIATVFYIVKRDAIIAEKIFGSYIFSANAAGQNHCRRSQRQ